MSANRNRQGSLYQRSFLHGAVILTVSTMIVKIIGMLYKIPLGNLLGAAGMSYFQTAYSIFNPVYALSIAGIPAAIAKMVSESYARGHYRNLRKIRRIAFAIMSLLGLISSGFLFWGSRMLAEWIGNPEAAFAVAAIAPAMFFCCLMAVWRGYYQGLSDMSPTAISQVVEAVGKLVVGIGLAWYLLQLGNRQYVLYGTVFGAVVENQGQAELAILPYAACGAILGVSVSSAVGTGYLALRHIMRGDGLDRGLIKGSPRPQPMGVIGRELAAIAVPVCLASMISHMTNLVDVTTVMHRVGRAMEVDGGAILRMYQGQLPQDLPHEGVPSFLYGAYGYAVNIFNLVPALTAAFGISALPTLAAHWATGNRKRAAEQAYSLVKLCSLIAIPAGLGLTVLAEPILEMLYPARAQEVAIAVPSLRILGIAGVFVGITTPVNSIFQAIGRAGLSVKLMLFGALIKVACNYALVAVPALNIMAVPYGTLLCYLFIVIGSLWELKRQLQSKQSFFSLLCRPVFCGILCAIAANTAYGLLSKWLSNRFSCLLSIVIASSIYMIFILFLRIITKNEVLMLPKGKKVAKILEKRALLG